MAARIQFGEYRFDVTGVPHYGERCQYESDGSGAPHTKITTYSITQSFLESSFADNEARISALRFALEAGEGLLTIEDENGTPLVPSVPVKVRNHNLPEAWRQTIAEVTVEFEARTPITSTAQGAMITPVGGNPISLPNIKTWREGFRTDRPLSNLGNRRETVASISGSGTIYADASLPPSSRIAYLRAQLATLRGANSKEATLEIGGESRLVKVESFDGDLGDGTDRLEWTISCNYLLFPFGTYAEADYEVASREDHESGKRYTTVQGEIRADSEGAADAKLDTLASFYANGRILNEKKVTDRRFDGEDGQDVWGQLNFTLEYEEALDDKLSWQLRVQTREDVRNADLVTSYEGTITGGTTASALAKARVLGSGKLPFMQASTETISSKVSGDSAEELVEVAFTYEYLAKSGTWRFAEITRTVQIDPLGEPRESISGYAAAGDSVTAKALADSFKLSGRLQRTERGGYQERMTVKAGTQTRQLSRYDFAFEYYLNFPDTSASYGREETNDYTSLERQVVFSGTAYGPTVTACKAMVDSIVADRTTGMNRVRDSIVENKDLFTGGSSFLKSVAFQYSFTGRLSGSTGILDAEYTLETVGSINRSVFTAIPFGTPHVQVGVGVTVGQKTVSGRCTAVDEASARAWGTGKRVLATAGGHEEPPQERMTFSYVAMSSTEVKAHRFEFSYSARFPQLTL